MFKSCRSPFSVVVFSATDPGAFGRPSPRKSASRPRQDSEILVFFLCFFCAFPHTGALASLPRAIPGPFAISSTYVGPRLAITYGIVNIQDSSLPGDAGQMDRGVHLHSAGTSKLLRRRLGDAGSQNAVVKQGLFHAFRLVFRLADSTKGRDPYVLGKPSDPTHS